MSLALAAVAVPLLVVAVIDDRVRGVRTLSDLFLLQQDLWPCEGMVALLLALSVVRGPVAPSPAQRPTPGLAMALAAAALLGLAGWVGAHTVMSGITLSADETMARFDAAILRGGHLIAPLDPTWRPYAQAMAPNFLLPTAGFTHWSSNYLPVNAGLQALAGLAGGSALAGALLSGVAVLATFGVARRVWPERPGRAWIAALLLACAPQTVLTGMTAYAMPGHLALNLMWLWLFLGRSRASHIAAAGMAFLACGLHQVVFHPLFAAPFVLHLWVGRRWGRATFHTLAYATIGLFWIGWFGLASRLEGAAPLPSASSLLNTLVHLLTHLDPDAPFLMIANAVRWIAWQNPLALPLWLLGAAAAWKGRGIERALAAAPLLTLAAVAVLEPYQGHGWGYRYLHGCGGAIALVGALGLTGLLDRRDAAGRRALWTGWSTALAATVLVLLPLRAVQARAWTVPYARALTAIRATHADAVVVDAASVFYGVDLVRNDPYLRIRPRLFAIEMLTPQTAAELCRRGPVAVFGTEEARAAGMGLIAPYPPRAAHAAEIRAALARAGCGGAQPGLRAVSTNSL